MGSNIDCLWPYQACCMWQTNYPLERLLLQRSGILFTAVQTGQVGKFDFATLVLTITTSLTFLTIAGIIVRIVATKLIGEKDYYESVMVDESTPYTVIKAH